NQMFQYAAGRRLAHTLGVQLKLDVTSYREPGNRDYLLHSFRIMESIAAAEEIEALTKRPPLMKRLVNRALGKPSPLARTHIRERSFRHDPTVLGLSNNVYLDGYWQSEKYFSDIADIISQELIPRDHLSGKATVMKAMIDESVSVSIHVRRGDYVSDEVTGMLHGTCSMDYYRECMGLIHEAFHDPVFFIFSDDPDWAEENLSINGSRVLVTTGSPVEDFWLMRCCRHHIIANSSFSWWSAWLGRSPEAVTLAPKQWFRDPSIDTGDLLPSGWRRV
ncbi:alpha-1,2-fucosyltransferase, partial [bacterium]|nr:alpha-1,2-fucosyltransferase [bacterium]